MQVTKSVAQEPKWQDYVYGLTEPEHTGPVKVRVLLTSYTHEFGDPRTIQVSAAPAKGPYNTYSYKRQGPVTQERLQREAEIICKALDHEEEWALDAKDVVKNAERIAARPETSP
jgi:hypothetical protein